MERREYKPLNCAIPLLAPDLDALCNSSLFADRVRILLHNIYVAYVFANIKSSEDEFFHAQGWVTLSAKRLERLLTNQYCEIISFCESHRLIEVKRTDNKTKSYKTNGRATPYRINPVLLPLTGKKFRLEKITSYKTVKAIHHNNAKRDLVKSHTPTYRFLDKLNDMLDDFYFDMDGLYKYINDVEAGKIQLPPKKKSKTLNRINHLYASAMTAELVNAGEKFRTSVCSFGERYHTIFTRLPGVFRPFLRQKGYSGSLCMIDIANSQAYCLALAISHPDKLMSLMPEFRPILTYFAQNKGHDRRLFMEYATEGILYDVWQQYRHFPKRDMAKDEMIKGLLFENPLHRQKIYSKAREDFAFLFPDVWKCIHQIKNTTEESLPFIKDLYLDGHGKYDDCALHKNASLLCQRIESRLVLGHVTKKLVDTPQMGSFLTIHDSFLVPESKINIVKVAINECFQALGLPAPKLKATLYTR